MIFKKDQDRHRIDFETTIGLKIGECIHTHAYTYKRQTHLTLSILHCVQKGKRKKKALFPANTGNLLQISPLVDHHSLSLFLSTNPSSFQTLAVRCSPPFRPWRSAARRVKINASSEPYCVPSSNLSLFTGA